AQFCGEASQNCGRRRNLRRPESFCGGSPKSSTPRTIFQRAAQNKNGPYSFTASRRRTVGGAELYAGLNRFAAPRANLRRLGQFFNALYRIRTACPVLRRDVAELWEAPKFTPA